MKDRQRERKTDRKKVKKERQDIDKGGYMYITLKTTFKEREWRGI